MHMPTRASLVCMKHVKVALLSGLLAVGFCLPATAQYSIDWFKVAGGGGASTGGAYSVSGTIGQHDADGPMTGGSYSLTGGFWTLITAVPTPGAPRLFITPSGSGVVVSWTNASTPFVLEHNSDLSNANGWSAVLSLPVTTDKVNYVTNPIAPGNDFYRLRQTF